MSVLERLEVPIVLAPLAGGPSTPELAAAVCEGGGLGFLAGGYLTAAALEERIAALRELTERPFGVNLFVPGEPSETRGYAGSARGARRAALRGRRLGSEARADGAGAAGRRLVHVRVSAREGSGPDGGGLGYRHPPGEAAIALAAGADGLVVQGSEAGGHRGVFADVPGAAQYGLLPLLQLIETSKPLIATGGIATGAAVAAVLRAGAGAAQVGTAFLRAPEAGTAAAHARRWRPTARPALTRAFTGRLARGIRNRFMDEHPDAPVAYPEIHFATAAMRAEARERGDAEAINLWAGEAHALAEEKPAAEILAELAAGAREALARAGRRLR